MIVALCFGTFAGAATSSVELEELTSNELRDAQKAGTTTIILPIGGTEQNGPHIALGRSELLKRGCPIILGPLLLLYSRG